MTEQRISMTNWRTDAQGDSPQCPRQPWYSPFAHLDNPVAKSPTRTVVFKSNCAI